MRTTDRVSEFEVVKIITMDHAAVNVSDVEVSRKFYTEQLGLTEMERPDFGFDGVWYLVGPNKEQFHLISHKEMLKRDLPSAEKPRIEHHIAFRVADVDATRKELESRGVQIMMQNERPDGVTQLFVQDPDGYVIEFSNYAV
jgi:glyoxylase I family protein